MVSTSLQWQAICISTVNTKRHHDINHSHSEDIKNVNLFSKCNHVVCLNHCNFAFRSSSLYPNQQQLMERTKSHPIVFFSFLIICFTWIYTDRVRASPKKGWPVCSSPTDELLYVKLLKKLKG